MKKQATSMSDILCNFNALNSTIISEFEAKRTIETISKLEKGGIAWKKYLATLQKPKKN